MRTAAATVVVLIVGTLVAGPALAGQPEPVDPSLSASDQCLDRSTVIALEGPQLRFPGSGSTPDGSALDARRASWTTDDPYPIFFREREGEGRRDLCLVGGHVVGQLPHDTTPWEGWHGTAGIVIQRHGFELIDTELTNVGDGVRFTERDSQNWTIRGVRMSRVHDDCVENDWMHSGTITDSFFDGCYVFYSARGAPGAETDGSANAVTITKSLVRMEPMPYLYDKSPGPGHGPIFKLSGTPSTGRSPRLVIRDTVFRVDQDASHGDLGLAALDLDGDPATTALPYLDPADCSNNTVVWLGEGPFPAELPDCFTITTDARVWRLAVADWETAPDEARQAAANAVEALVRATCGRIGQSAEN